ncbi:MAG: MBOAT family protein [Acidobacteria bacterium]|nr:MAG: MBOAT family protein [Acidobacteriota bacterium]
MVFSSHLFCFYFLPLALGVYYALPQRGRHLGLTLLSYLFYGWANPAFVFLMLFSTAVDYACGLTIARHRPGTPGPIARLEPDGGRSRAQKAALVTSIVTNLSLLGFFKYFNFATDSYDAILAYLGLAHLQLDLALRITLPLGISFYTFQSMSYTIDVYRGHCAALKNPLDFACYVSMFPQLVAGPILRFSEVADQLHSRTHTIEKVARGWSFFALGMAKKILLANPCGKVADLAFDGGGVTTLDAWYGVIAYAFQIYFDFSGYSDMAIGLGLMLGFVFPKNFDSPYTSQSITEFWRRWHLSLSRYLRDYLYIPLGGNRRGTARTYANLMIVMLLGGLWHGASWTFVLWGAYHGLLLAAERRLGGVRAWAFLPAPLRVALTFVLVLGSWVLFRAASLGEATAYLGRLVGLGETPPAALLTAGVIHRPYYLATVAVAALVTWGAPQTWDWTRRLTAPRAAVALGLFVAALLAMETQGYNPFIYFIF